MLETVFTSSVAECVDLKTAGQPQNAGNGPHSDRQLTTRITAVLAALAFAVIAATLYAGIKMNESALGIESGIIEKEINRVVVKTLDEQKSVALWDEAVDRIGRRDLEWIDNEIGSYLSGTYGHDRVLVLGSDGSVIYEHDRQGNRRGAMRDLAAARPLLEEIRSGQARHWVKRDGKFSTLEASEDQLAGASQLKAGANLLWLSDHAAVVSAMTVTPTHDLKLLQPRPPIIVSVIDLNPARLKLMGEDVNIRDLRLIKGDDGLIPISADDGAPIGSLTWTPQHPGRTFLTVLLPVILIVTIAGMLAGRYLVGRMTVLADRLRQSAADSHRLAFEDQVSKLPNRRAFQQKLENLCASNARPFAVAILDVDRFKEVNDTYGHETGDRLIAAVGARLLETIGDEGMVARLGGDEFAVVAMLPPKASADGLKRKLGKLFGAPFQLGPYRILASASIGLCVVSDTASPARVLREADTALYEAKARGRRQTVIYAPQMSDALRGRRVVERDLQDAIDKGHLYLLYQPLLAEAEDAGPEVEALVRWRHPQLGDLSPEAFVPIAEQSDLIVALGRAVFRMALEHLASWPAMRISVNISPRELRSSEFLRFVRDTCRTYGVAPARITFEVTEGVAIDDSGKANLLLQSLRALGFRVALDDFGSGYASLSFLQTYPLDRVKLDRSLLTGAGDQNVPTAVLEGAVSIGLKLGLEVVAEGVETEEQLAFVRALGCTHVQGFCISRPLRREDVAGFFGLGGSARKASITKR